MKNFHPAIFLIILCSMIFSCNQVNRAKPLPPKAKAPETPLVKEEPEVHQAHHQPIRLNLMDVSEIPEEALLVKTMAASPIILNKTGYGSGFLISDDGLILTDLHVVFLDSNVKVKFFNQAGEDDNFIEERSTIPGKVVAWSNDTDPDSGLDLALVKINPQAIPCDVVPLELAKSNVLSKAQPLWRFGYNKGYRWAYGFFTPNLDDKPRAKMLMPTGGGASGGPIINMEGQAVGILQQGHEGDDEVIVKKGIRKTRFTFSKAYFLPIDKINSFLREPIPSKYYKHKSAR